MGIIDTITSKKPLPKAKKSDAKVMQPASIDFTGVTEDCLFNPSKPLCIKF